MIYMKLRQGGTYTPLTITFTTVGNQIVHYRHDADIIQTGKIDYVLSCIFTSLQRVDMFLKSYSLILRLLKHNFKNYNTTTTHW
jgi:hypothetical protein